MALEARIHDVEDMDPYILHHQYHALWHNEAGPWFDIKISSYEYRKSNCGDKLIKRSSYLRNGYSYTGKTAAAMVKT